MQTPGGSFAHSGATYYRDNKGEVYVYVAPEGGWNAAPRADRDAQGNPKTLIAARVDARNFDPARHYSPGPLRRITAPDAVLVDQLWPNAQSSWLGEGLAISPDGTTVIADADVGTTGRAHVFQQSSVAAWRELNGEYMTPTAQINGVGDIPSHGNMAFSGDHSELAIVEAEDSRVHVFRLPANGRWASGHVNDADEIARRNGVQWILKDGHNGAQIVFGRGGAITTSDAGCTIEVVDEISTTTCPITLPSSTVVVPEGTADGAVTLSGQVTLQLEDVEDSTVTLRNALELRIGEVREVAEVKLDLAVDKKGTTSTSDDTPYPSALRRQGDSTRLRLTILSESGAPSHAGSIAAAQLTSTAGNLAVVDATLEGDSCAGISCTLNAANINASNADELLVTLSHEGKTAVAEVRATVFSTTGDTFETPPVRIALAGAAASIAVSAPPTGVTNVDAADLDADGLISDGAATRDELLLAVTAADSAGNDVALPSGARRTRLLGPDGQPVAAESVRVTWPHRGDPTKPFTRSGGDNPPILNTKSQAQVKIDVNRPAANPLASGEYTLELWAGQQKAVRTFSVSGGAAEISLSDPGAVRVGETFSVTATFNDASGGRGAQRHGGGLAGDCGGGRWRPAGGADEQADAHEGRAGDGELPGGRRGRRGGDGGGGLRGAAHVGGDDRNPVRGARGAAGGNSAHRGGGEQPGRVADHARARRSGQLPRRGAGQRRRAAGGPARGRQRAALAQRRMDPLRGVGRRGDSGLDQFPDQAGRDSVAGGIGGRAGTCGAFRHSCAGRNGG